MIKINKDDYLAVMIDECEFDYCFMKTDEVVCNYLEIMAEECRASARLILEFRSETLCGELMTPKGFSVIVLA